MEILALRNLSFTYPGRTEKALDGVSLTVNAGDFLVLCGASGSGKSTLLRQLKPALAPRGERLGEIRFCGEPLESVDARRQASEIGFVLQSPDNQLVTDKVWHELAFGAESLGLDGDTIRRRVAEMASVFGMEAWLSKDVSELSGGQKQLLNLASVMVMHPSVLVLDEPTAQLDPIAAADFLTVLGRINRELGTTVILTEHRLEEALPLANRAAVMEAGRVLCAGRPAEIGESLRKAGHGMFLAMPTATRLWAVADGRGDCPITVREGRDWLGRYTACHALSPLPAERPAHGADGEYAIEIENARFAYRQDLPDVVRGLNLKVRKGEFLALLGGNGAGKSTTLRLIAGIAKPYRGTVKRSGRVALLPQNPQTLFDCDTVRAELFDLLRDRELPQDEQERLAGRVVKLCRLEGLLERNPYELSGGEQQRAALAKVLLTEPDILLLDEPTKGLDAEFKRRLAGILRAVQAHGVTLVAVSHDLDFCAETADRCALLFDGSISAEGTPRAFFAGSSYYTTAANRIARAVNPEVVTVEDAASVLAPEASSEPEETSDLYGRTDTAVIRTPEAAPAERLPLWRKITAWVCGLCSAAAMLFASGLIKVGGTDGIGQAVLYAVLTAGLLGLGLSVLRRDKTAVRTERKAVKGRTAAASVCVLLLVPSTLTVASVCVLLLVPSTLAVALLWGNGSYYPAAVAVLIECMLPFFIRLEGRKPEARELVKLAVLCALGVAGRAAFFMLPQFKPVMAIAILAGVTMGAESGFLVGSVTMFVSNMLFSQGPWTPWQMFCMGIIGFIAGLIFGRGRIRATVPALCVYGAFSAIVIYGGIMNPASALIWGGAGTLTWEVLLAFWATGFPLDCVHAAATVIFLLLAGKPMMKKLTADSR